MALTLGNLSGFTTGGLHEASNTTGSPAVVTSATKTPRTGTYCLQLQHNDIFVFSAREAGGSAGNDHIVGFGVLWADVTPTTKTSFLRWRDELSNELYILSLDTDGEIEVTYNDSSTTKTSGLSLTNDKWHFFEIRSQLSASGNFDLWVDGSSEISDTGKDMISTGTSSNRFRFEAQVASGTAETTYIDDFYTYHGATGTSDFLGVGTEILGGFGNDVEDGTDQGSALDIGTWANAGVVPWSEAANAEYDTNGATGYTQADNADSNTIYGPLAELTGTSKAGKWMTWMERQGGGASTHYLVHGMYNGASHNVQDSADLGLTTDPAFYSVFSESATYVPQDSGDYFDIGMHLSGARDMLAYGLLACLLHVAPPPDQTVTLEEITLASAPQDLTVVLSTGDQTVVLEEITLVSSPQALTVVPGAVTVTLEEITLASSPQALTVVPGAVTVVLEEITLASSPQALTVNAAQTITLEEITLASSSQALTVKFTDITGIIRLKTGGANYPGPYRDGNGNIYIFGGADNDLDKKRIIKSDDDGTTWSIQDSGNEPVYVGVTSLNNGMASVQNGTIVHTLGMGDDGVPYYSTFNTSDAGANPDTWQIKMEDTGGSASDDTRHCSIAVRSDGDVVITYTGPDETVDVTDYQRQYYIVKDGTWGTPTPIVSGDAEAFFQSVVVIGESDLAHIFYTSSQATQNLYHKSLTAGGSLSGQETVNDTLIDFSIMVMGKPAVHVQDGSDDYAYVAWEKDSPADVAVSYVKNDGVPSSEVSASDNTVGNQAGFTNLSMAKDDNLERVFIVYSNVADNDIYLDQAFVGKSWGTDVEIQDAVTAESVYANYYQNPVNKIGVLYRVGDVADDLVYFEYVPNLIIRLDALTLASSAQNLTVVSDRIVALEEITLVSSPQALTVKQDQTVVLEELTLASSPQALTVIPGAVTVVLEEITLTSSPQALNVVVDQTVVLEEITLASSPQALTVIPGAVTVVLEEITLVSSPQVLTVEVDQTVSLQDITLVSSIQSLIVVPGAVTVTLEEITLASSAQALKDVAVDQTVVLEEITLASSAQALTVVPGTATVTLEEITLASSAQALTVEVDQIVSLQDITLVSSPQALTVVPGAVTVVLEETTLISSPQALTVNNKQTVTLEEVTLASSAQALTVKIDQTVVLEEITLASAPQNLTVNNKQTVTLEEITLVSSPQSLTVIPGAVTVTLEEITLTASAQALTVNNKQTVALNEITLASAPQALTVKIDQTVVLEEITLTSSPQNLTVNNKQTITLNDITLASSSQALTVIPGAVAVVLEEITLASSPQTLTVVINLTVALEEITLASSPQALTVVPGAVAVVLEEITLASSPQALNVTVDQIVALGDITLASSPQALTVAVSVTVTLEEITLASSPQSLTVIPGAVTVTLEEITLASTPQALTVNNKQTVVLEEITLVSSIQALIVVPGGVTAVLEEITLVSSPQTLTVNNKQTVVLGDITLASSPQALTVVPGAVAIALGDITLVSSPQTLTVNNKQTVVLEEIALASAPQALTVNNKQTVTLNDITLAASAQTLTINNKQIVTLEEITLASSAQTLTVVPGAVAVVLEEITLVSGAQALTVAIVVGQVVSLSVATITTTIPTLTVIPGGVIIGLSVVTLTSTVLSASPVGILFDIIGLSGTYELESTLNAEHELDAGLGGTYDLSSITLEAEV